MKFFKKKNSKDVQDKILVANLKIITGKVNELQDNQDTIVNRVNDAFTKIARIEENLNFVMAAPLKMEKALQITIGIQNQMRDQMRDEINTIKSIDYRLVCLRDRMQTLEKDLQKPKPKKPAKRKGAKK